MATAATCLWTLAVLRTYVGITSGSDLTQDANLEFIANGVTDLIEKMHGRPYVTRAITEVRSGDGRKWLFVDKRPMTVLSTLTIKRAPSDTTPESITISTGTETDLKRGGIRLIDSVFTKGVGNVTIGYSAGVGAQGAATLPQDVYQAGLDLVKAIYDEKVTGVQAASSVSVGSATFLIKPEYPKHVKDMLASRCPVDVL